MLTKLEKLSLINDKACQCTKCPELASTRNKVVFADGNPDADTMVIGEGPGAQENEEGKPFVGKSGKLLTNILASAGWKREELYICNIVKCRPPNNREPSAEEASNCRPFLDLQIKTVNPKYILCFGKTAVFYLLKLETSIDKFKISSYRKKIYDLDGKKVLATYHPSYALRNPSAKQEIYGDLMFFKKSVGLQSSEIT